MALRGPAGHKEAVAALVQPDSQENAFSASDRRLATADSPPTTGGVREQPQPPRAAAAAPQPPQEQKGLKGIERQLQRQRERMLKRMMEARDKKDEQP